MVRNFSVTEPHTASGGDEQIGGFLKLSANMDLSGSHSASNYQEGGRMASWPFDYDQVKGREWVV